MSDTSAAKPAISGFEKSAPSNRSTLGPFDFAESSELRPYIDLGAILIPPRPGLNLRLQVEESNQRAVAVDLEYEGSTLQLQAFAAPRSEGLWFDILNQIDAQIVQQGGTVDVTQGPLGPEIHGTVRGQDNTTAKIRFIGVDGPRWFLRGVITGNALNDTEAAEEIIALYRQVVVRRGDGPMPPRELIPLHIPSEAEDAVLRAGYSQAELQ